MRPLETASRPAIIRSAVVLPDPDAPSRTRNSPSLTSRSSSCSTLTAPNDFATLSRTTVISNSSLDGTKEKTLGDKPLEEQRQDDDRDNHDHDQHAHIPPLRSTGCILSSDKQRNGLGPHSREEEGEEILVPCKDEDEQRRGDEARCRERQDDLGKDAKTRGAIDLGRLFQVLGNRGEEIVH